MGEIIQIQSAVVMLLVVCKVLILAEVQTAVQHVLCYIVVCIFYSFGLVSKLMGHLGTFPPQILLLTPPPQQQQEPKVVLLHLLG